MKDRKEVIEQVLKLLSLSQGTSYAEEAEAARRKAERLLAKHDISISELEIKEEKFEEHKFDSGKLDVDKYRLWMLNRICKFNGVYMTRTKGYSFYRGHKVNTKFNLYGRPQDVENAKYMYDILDTQMRIAENVASKMAKKTRGYAFTNYDVNGFRHGFYYAIDSRLDALERTVADARTEMGLVPVSAYHSLLVRAESEYLSMHKVRFSNGRDSYQSSYGRAAGKEAGNKASITRGVTNGGGNKQLALGR